MIITPQTHKQSLKSNYIIFEFLRENKIYLKIGGDFILKFADVINHMVEEQNNSCELKISIILSNEQIT